MEPDPEPSPKPPLDASSDLALAIGLLLDRKVIVYPTETFYGFLAGAFFPEALEKIMLLKGRKHPSPLPCIIGDPDDLPRLAARINERQRVLMDLFWPGPLTLVFDAAPAVPAEITGDTGSVGVRMPGHEGARELASRAGPLAATSANLSGELAPLTISEIKDMFAGVTVFDSGALSPSRGSTVLDVRTEKPILIRDGDVPADALGRALKINVEKGAR